MRLPKWTYWVVPLLLYSANAQAWGLLTHLYFTQLLIWSVPLADPRLRRAARAFPQLVLAGACLPDLALIGRSARTQAFRTSHDWYSAARLLERASEDEARALALGYASHLLVDIVAHNHFVPMHERIWLPLPMLMHAASEWAMDAHIAAHVPRPPHVILGAQHDILTQYVQREFACSDAVARRALIHLRRANRILYAPRIPALIYAGARCLDSSLSRRFDRYLVHVQERLPEINRLLAGDVPRLRADKPCPQQQQALRILSRAQARAAFAPPATW